MIQGSSSCPQATHRQPCEDGRAPAEDREKLRLGWAENRPGNENELVGDRDWAPMVRAIDRVDTGYRE